MASIWEVAKAAKVAPSTVSLVVNHRDRVSAPTRKRVEEVIARMGYRARGRQQRPANSRNLNLVFLYSSVALVDNTLGSYCRDLIDGVRQGLTDKSASLNTHRSVEDVSRDSIFLEQLDAGDFDGALLVGAEPGSGYIDRLIEMNVPAVLFNRFPDQGQFSAVTVDYYGAGKLAAQHLTELGHKCIAMPRPANGHPTHWYLHQFFDAVSSVAKSAGAEIVIETGSPDADLLDNERIGAFCRKAIAAGATAICAGDRFAVVCLRLLDQMGIDVPGKISVLGIDDLGFMSPKGLKLTSIGYNKHLMGVLGGQLIEKHVLLPDLQFMTAGVKCQLIEGQTTAVPVVV